MLIRDDFAGNSCRKTFYQSLPEVDEKRLMTTRLLQWMGKQAIRRTFASIAEEVGCTEYTVRSVFRDYVNTLEGKQPALKFLNGWGLMKFT